MNVNVPFFIFSAEKPEYDGSVNTQRTDFCRRHLEHNDIGYTPVLGVWYGHDESATIAWAYDIDHTRDVVERLARRYGQTAILEVDANRHACLIYIESGVIEEIGPWHEISASTAATLPSYTITPDGRCWTA